ncbi:GGDEF domain-containing protein [Shewanella sp. UCD-KL12]|uniref:GGDEF domain-containing protein n=1 Tax=Shewanella sp. UCD-KL12 TaxID=1917163 RepID=UPI0015C3407D|nr:GGDEF domain-containing protein [Shewanella sp. UCD-KL12]
MTERNRLIPISVLYEVPTQKQISLYQQLAPEAFLHENENGGSAKLLILKNNTDQQRNWILTSLSPFEAEKSPILIRYPNKTVTKLSGQIIHWPAQVELHEITIRANERVEILFNQTDLPTQLWSQEWLTNKLGQYSQYSSLMWGAILSVLLLHLCNCTLLAGRNLKSVLLQISLAAVLANELGLFKLVMPTSYQEASTHLLLSISLLLMIHILEHQSKTSQFTQNNQLLTVLNSAAILGIITSLVLTQVTIESLASLLPHYLLSCFVILLSISIYGLFKTRGFEYLCHLGCILFITLFCGLIQNSANIADKLLLYLPILGVSLLSFTSLQAKLAELSINTFKPEYNPSLNKAELQHKFQELEMSHRLLQEKNAIDFLTGLKNRQFFDDSYHSELARSAREGTPLSLILIDLDHFKSVNDNYGHQVGDEVLKMVAKRFYYALNRPADAICRYGGEEFVILLPNTHIQGAKHIAEQIGKAVNTKPILTAQGDINITISQGVASLTHHSSIDDLQLLNLADKALYRAKGLGRNRFEVASSKPYIVKEQA